MRYQVTVLADPEGDEVAGGRFGIEVPLSDPGILKEVALESIGVFEPKFYSIEEAEGSGFIIRDPSGEPFLGLEEDDGTFFDPEEESDTDFLLLLDEGF